MFDDDSGADEATDTLERSLDPVAIATAAAGVFQHHPLFPREDGSPETRDIQFVSFCRKRTGDQAMQNCPEDIPAHEVKSWAQVVQWWGGGEYKAIAKNGKHQMIAWYPNTGGDWLVFDGDSKPFTLRNGKGYPAPGPTVAQPAQDAPPPAPGPALAAQDDLRGMLTEVLRELRTTRATSPPPANDSALVAMIQAQAAQATAASQANTQIMQTLLSVVAQRPAETGARPAEPTALALQLIGAVQKLVPTPVAQPGLAEQIPLIKALRDLSQPAAPASEFQPLVDMFGQVMAADAASKQAEAARAQTSSKPQEPQAPRPPPRPRPALVHVPGVGMVEVVAPDASALRFGDMSVEERAAAIRKDPALLRELGLGLPTSATASPPAGARAQSAPASPASPVRPGVAVVEAVPAIPAVPDLEPTPAPVVTATLLVPSASSPALADVATVPLEAATIAAAPPVSSSTGSPAPVFVAAMPPAPETLVAAPPPSPAAPTPPSRIAATPVEPPAPASEERPAIALPARMPVAEPLHATEHERLRAMGELKRLTSLTHEQRVAALRKLPGIGAMADDVALAMGSLPADALMAMAQTLDIDAIGALARSASGVAGG